MNWLESELNNKIAQELTATISKYNLKQLKIQLKIQEMFEKEMIKAAREKSISLTTDEIDAYFSINFERLDPLLQKKLKKIGIHDSYHPVAISTISNYMNGNAKIPAYFVRIIEKMANNS